MVERARLESEYTGNRIGGSNPPLSATLFHIFPIHKAYRSLNLKNLFFVPLFVPLKFLLDLVVSA